MQLFRALEKILNCLLAQENMKKPSSKVAHNSCLEVFYAAFLEQPIQPKIAFPYWKLGPGTLCPFYMRQHVTYFINTYLVGSISW